MRLKPIPQNTVVHTPTEAETKEETMETKDAIKALNLCELLKGHEGEYFFSPVFGECKLRNIYKDNNKGCQPLINVMLADGDSRNIASTGHLSWNVRRHGNVIFFPSRALYEQYPLDPYTAWMKWQEKQLKCKMYLMIEDECNENLYADSYIFHNTADRDKCISEIKAIIEKYSKK